MHWRQQYVTRRQHDQQRPRRTSVKKRPIYLSSALASSLPAAGSTKTCACILPLRLPTPPLLNGDTFSRYPLNPERDQRFQHKPIVAQQGLFVGNLALRFLPASAERLPKPFAYPLSRRQVYIWYRA